MWNRSELKSNAKSVLRRNFWVAFLVCLILTILSGDFGNNDANVDVIYNMNEADLNTSVQAFSSLLPFNVPDLSNAFFAGFVGIFVLIALVVSMCFQILVVNPLLVGKKRYFIESIENTSSIKSVFRIFTDGNYWNIVKIMLLMDIKVVLWTLCFILPGIVKGYEYFMVSYLLAEDGSRSSSDVFERSKAMTDNHKFDIFVLELSFIGWYILCGFTLGFGVLFLNPYKEATYAELYYASKQFVLE